MRNFLRLSPLSLAVILLYVWLLGFVPQLIAAGQRRLVDRNDRRDLSQFRIGSNMVERLLANRLPLRISFNFYT